MYFAPSGFNCSAMEVPVHSASQAYGEPAVPTPGRATDSGNWCQSWQMPTGQPVESLTPVMVFVPSYSVEPPLGYAATPHHSSWHPAPACTSFNYEESIPSSVPGFSEFSQPVVAAAPLVLDLAGRLNLNLEGCQQAPSTGTEAWTPSASGLCTPEITPRYYAPEATPKPQTRPGNMVQEIAPKLADTVDRSEHYASAELVKGRVVDEFSECGSSDDEKDHVCWDFDIHAALLIRAQRDSNSYASSETSTAVSLTPASRRRRGRRVAKGKARSTMAILESPPIEEVLVTEQRKAELIQQLELGGESMHKAVSSILGSVLRMSLEPFGCRVIQSALEVASMAEKEALAAELHDHVRLVTTSPHANFVIQKVIEVLPVSSTHFVAEELATIAVDVAQHRFGCRVLSRLVEHHLSGDAASPSTNKLVEELLLGTDQLIRHNFARHVLELILEHGSDTHKHSIAKTIQNNIFYYAKNRCASYVLEKALTLCSISDACTIVSALLVDPKEFFALAVHECGTHVVRAVLRSNTEEVAKARDLLLKDTQQMKSSKYGKRLLDEVGQMSW